MALAPLGHRRQRERRREPHDVGIALPPRQVAARSGDDADRQRGVVLAGKRPGLAEHRADRQRAVLGLLVGLVPPEQQHLLHPEREQPEQVAAQTEGVAVAGVEHGDGLVAVAPHLRRDHQPRHRRPRRGVVGHEEARGDRREHIELATDRREVRAVRDVELGRDIESRHVQRHDTSVSDPVSTS